MGHRTPSVLDARQPAAWHSAWHLKSERGFSLFQVIMGLQLMAILFAVGVSQMSNYSLRYRMMGSADQVGFDIARARMQAISQNRYARIKLLSTTQYARETSSDLTTWSNRVTTTLPSGLKFTSESAEVRFDKKGTATVSDTIGLFAKYSRSQQQTRLLTTSIIGQVTITDG